MRERAHLYRNLVVFLICLALASACNLSKATPTPLPTPDLPTVEILAPPTNQRVIEGTDFDFDILATDTSYGIQRVDLYVDDILLKSSEIDAGAEAKYRVTMNWYARGLGLHSFKVIAYRPNGTASNEHIITLQVIPRS